MAGPPSSTNSSKATLTNLTPEYSPVFLRIRSIAFALICFVTFLCIVILCLQMYLEWDDAPSSKHSLVEVMLMIYTITILMLPVLIILKFRPWLDALRLALLLILHIGTGALFAKLFRRFQSACPSSRQQCLLYNMYILIGSWILSALLLVYATGLALMIYRRSEVVADDESTIDGRTSFLPIMKPPLLPSPLPIASQFVHGGWNPLPPSRHSGRFTIPVNMIQTEMSMALPSPSYSHHVSVILPPRHKPMTIGSPHYGVAL